MSFVDAVRNSNDMIYLVRLKEAATGDDAWYYVRVHSKQKLPIFLEKVKTGITLTDYGDVLYSGWGTEPPQHIKDKIRKMIEG